MSSIGLKQSPLLSGLSEMPTKSELEKELASVKAENERLKEQLEHEEDDDFDDDDDEGGCSEWIFPAIIGVIAGIWLS